ncbi:MAG: amino acid adenylation domain-containing protein [bacterium]|nr:amino acid adenylation domain-containing protein [bacterium]
MKNQCIDFKIARFARLNPGKTAIQSEDRRVTYRQLETHSNRIANHLHEQMAEQAGENPHIVILLDRSPEIIEAILGVLKSGLVFVPVSPGFPVEHVHTLITETRAQWVITNDANHRKFKDAFPTGTNVLLLGGDPLPGGDQLLFQREFQKNCYIYFTSGSTGTPKAVIGRQKGLDHFLQWEINEFRITPDFNFSQLTPPTFDPYLRDIFVPLTAGATIHIPSNDTLLNMGKLIPWIEDRRINFIHTVPSLFKRLAAEIHDAGQMSHLKYILLAGELVRGRDLHRFIDIFGERIQLVNIYGPTETTLAKLFYRIQPRDVERPVIPVGKPIEGAQVLILNDQMKKSLPGKRGEIYIRTPFRSSGYFNAPQLLEKVFLKNPFGKHPQDIIYKTGDLGRLLPDGNIELSGRVDFQVKIRGARIEMGAVENLLLAHDQVKEAVVTAKEDKNNEKFLCAYILPNDGEKLTAPALREYLVTRLPEYGIPSYFVFLDTIPLNANGKVDRSKLPEPDRDVLISNADYVAPETPMEGQITAIWQEVLNLDKVGVTSNFFDLGGNSLKIMEVLNRFSKEFKQEIPLAKLFEHSTVRALAGYVMEMNESGTPLADALMNPAVPAKTGAPFSGDIAVVGMACRFPGARDIYEFWDNLKKGKETITFFSPGDLAGAGISSDGHFVPAASILEDKEYFDAAFFGYTPKEATLLDPQTRLFHECAWAALQDGGIDPGTYNGRVGVYAGAVQNLEWELRAAFSGETKAIGGFAASKLTGIRYLCTRLSYNLNLTGPSVTMQTACSTSLVAVHMGVKAILNGECDAALAGGVTVYPGQRRGYMYEEDMIFSSDGHCRPFDAQSSGTVFGEGVGAVLLKSLEKARTHQDYIYAVIKGTAVNNDGNRKVGFTAPSVTGQVNVMRDAIQAARIEPASITYVEAHGTGTAMGDPIEVEALTQVYNADNRKPCMLGSVKSNFGHLDAAAGIAGFIKTVLALNHRAIPPTLHYQTPNPAIQFAETPFETATAFTPWTAAGTSLRAAISSLGMGGTNAHAILEEAPPTEPSSEDGQFQLILLSARNESTLEQGSRQLAHFVQTNPDAGLEDIAYTLQTRRKRFNHRLALTCHGRGDVAALSDLASSTHRSHVSDENKRPVIFMFSGQGAQYIDMARDLYQGRELFRTEVDKCLALSAPRFQYNLKDILYPEGPTEEAEKQIINTADTQPLLFILEYALAKQLMAWGVQPAAMIGHSIGEYVAACLSGVLSLEDALKLVELRGALMQDMANGSMLSVPVSAEELKPLLNEKLDLAAVNSSSSCVVSGTDEDIAACARELEAADYQPRILQTAYAFHSWMMDPMLEKFEEALRSFQFDPPEIPYISNVTGDWITHEQVKYPAYWSAHVRNTVMFDRGLETLFTYPNAIFVEVGPGNALTKFARRHEKKNHNHLFLNMIRHPKEEVNDNRYLLDKIGKLWMYGQSIDWRSFYDGGKRNVIPLPSYPFERQYYWLEAVDFDKPAGPAASPVNKDIEDWFYIPSWKRTLLPNPVNTSISGGTNLVFVDKCGLSDPLAEKLEARGETVILVEPGTAFQQNSALSYTLDPASSNDYDTLFNQLVQNRHIPSRIFHLWNVTNVKPDLSSPYVGTAQDTGYYSLINIAKAIGNVMIEEDIDMIAVTDNMWNVLGGETGDPAKITILGPIHVIPQEYDNISCRAVDIAFTRNPGADGARIINDLLNEARQDMPQAIIAYRGGHRWVQHMEPVKPPPPDHTPAGIKKPGVYLVTGGLGGIGLVLAQYLSSSVQANLVLTGRADFPARDRWDHWPAEKGEQDPTSQKINGIKEMEANGSTVVYIQADSADAAAMSEKIKAAEAQLGDISGVIHAAGIADFAGVIHRRSRENNEKVFASKLEGTLVLDRIFKDRKLDFFVLCSSMSSLCAHFGQVGYSSANAFMDAYAAYKNRDGQSNVISINWDSWKVVGMAAQRFGQLNPGQAEFDQGISPDQGIDIFKRALDQLFSNLAVSTIDFELRMETHQVNGRNTKDNDETRSPEFFSGPSAAAKDPSPISFTSVHEVELKIIEIWKGLLGFDAIGLNDNFFELGGDSLSAINIRKEVKKIFNLDVPLVKLFHHPTVATFVKNVIIKGEEPDAEGVKEESGEEITGDFSDILGKFEGV